MTEFFYYSLSQVNNYLHFLQHDDSAKLGIDAINTLLDSFMGINDTELATLVCIYNVQNRTFNIQFYFPLPAQIWDLANHKTNSMDFAEAIDNSDLEAFGFTDDFIIELWGAITDARRHK